MEFEWDEAKHAKTLSERGIGFDDGARIFEGPVAIWQDTRRNYGELQFRAVGQSEDDVLHVVFTWRETGCELFRCGAPVTRKLKHGYHANGAKPDQGTAVETQSPKVKGDY